MFYKPLDAKVGSGYRMEITSNRKNATAFIQTRPGSALQAVIGGKEPESGRSGDQKQAQVHKQRYLLQCQLRPRTLRPEAQPPRNSYFTKDLRELMQSMFILLEFSFLIIISVTLAFSRIRSQ